MATERWKLVAVIATIAGCGLVIAGVTAIYVPAGLITMGILLTAIGLLYDPTDET